jgi:hypothetical protein
VIQFYSRTRFFVHHRLSRFKKRFATLHTCITAPLEMHVILNPIIIQQTFIHSPLSSFTLFTISAYSSNPFSFPHKRTGDLPTFNFDMLQSSTSRQRRDVIPFNTTLDLVISGEEEKQWIQIHLALTPIHQNNCKRKISSNHDNNYNNYNKSGIGTDSTSSRDQILRLNSDNR